MIVDTATVIALGAVGLDTSGETVPYVAGWGEAGALEAVTEFAKLIDGLARRVEAAITPGEDAETVANSLAQPLQGARAASVMGVTDGA